MTFVRNEKPRQHDDVKPRQYIMTAKLTRGALSGYFLNLVQKIHPFLLQCLNWLAIVKHLRIFLGVLDKLR